MLQVYTHHPSPCMRGRLRSTMDNTRAHTESQSATADNESASAWFAERSTALWVCGNDSRSDFLELKMLEKSSLGDLR